VSNILDFRKWCIIQNIWWCIGTISISFHNQSHWNVV